MTTPQPLPAPEIRWVELFPESAEPAWIRTVGVGRDGAVWFPLAWNVYGPRGEIPRGGRPRTRRN